MGTAGTGKSTLAKQRADNYDDAIFCATTGIAAINQGGVTLNSVLHYYDLADLKAKTESGQIARMLRILQKQGIHRIILDEVSMMDGRAVDYLIEALDDVNQTLEMLGDRPIGLTLVGDFGQLPPVKSTVFAFHAKAWPRFEIETLTIPRRQADPAFVTALQDVRKGRAAPALAYFRQFLHTAPDETFGSTILSKNDDVDTYNRTRMARLQTPPDIYPVNRGGPQSPDWKHIPEQLSLKPGAYVMILANAYEDGDGTSGNVNRAMLYANGDCGEYLGQHYYYSAPNTPLRPSGSARVKLVRTGEEVVVGRIIREKGAKKVKALVTEADKAKALKFGYIDYLPLRAAWATTVHKSQGLSLDRVQLLIKDKFWMHGQMLYVGLSRARTPEGLRIVGSPEQFAARCRVVQAVKEWL